MMETTTDPPAVDLTVSIGSLSLANPVLVASGTFGYARELAGLVDFSLLGGILPKTITREPRKGNPPPRTAETTAGLLNAIGLDNDGLEHFLTHRLPYLASLPTSLIVSIAGRSIEEFTEMAGELDGAAGVDALELNISCPNVSGGVDYGVSPARCEELLRQVRSRCHLPLIAKLTPNVTRVDEMARAAEAGGADAVSLINTVSALGVDWRRCRSLLGNGLGGLSGPSIKPIALRCVWQAAQAVSIPVIGIGGISSLDDAMEFAVCGASAIQVGTANYYDPTLAQRIAASLPAAVAELGAHKWMDVVGKLQMP